MEVGQGPNWDCSAKEKKNVPSQCQPENLEASSISDGWNDFTHYHIYSLNIISPSMDIT
jgi:hypothetical protein